MRFLSILLCILISLNVWANRCDLDILSLDQKRAQFQEFIQAKPDHPLVTTFRKFEALDNEFKNLLPEHEIYSVLLDKEMG